MYVKETVCTALLCVGAVAVPASAVICCRTLISNGDAIRPTDENVELFGASAAVDGDFAVVGAPEFDDGADDIGRAVVFEYSGGSWSEDDVLSNPGAQPNDKFGYSVAISGDLIVIGTPGDTSATGRADIYELDTGVWVRRDDLTGVSAGDEFGKSVSVAGDTIVVGAPGADSAYVYERNIGECGADEWCLDDTLTGDASFGSAVSIFDDSTDAWIAVGAPEGGTNARGEIDVFEFDSGWTLLNTVGPDGSDTDDDGFGAAIEIGKDLLVVGAPTHDEGDPEQTDAGAAYVFRYDGGSDEFEREARVTACDPEANAEFGRSVALSDAATGLVLIGSPLEDSINVSTDTGAAYVFRFDDPPGWVLISDLVLTSKATGDELATAVALSSSHLLVTAVGFDSGEGALFPSEESFATAEKCCNGDLDEDNDVDFEDLLMLLDAWGPCMDCDEDLDGDDDVDFGDLVALLARWGLCGGVPGTGPSSVEDELSCRDIDEACWEGEDGFLDLLENGSVAEQDNAICWLNHYDTCHCPDTCTSGPTGCGDDPCGQH